MALPGPDGPSLRSSASREGSWHYKRAARLNLVGRSRASEARLAAIEKAPSEHAPRLHLLPGLERRREGAVVEVFELAADGHPLGEAGDRDAGALEAAPFANTLRAGVAARRWPVPSR